MIRAFLRFSTIVACFSLASLAATAQEIVHALAGTVTFIDSAQKTITVKTDDGPEAIFKDMINPTTSIVFDQNIRTDAIAADEFKKSGVRVIVYYFGIGDVRTVVALRSLGPGPFTISSGTVVDFDKKNHTFSIKDTTGQVESFSIVSNTVVETAFGAQEGSSFSPSKGDQVRVTSANVIGSAAALFINTLVAH